MGPDSRFYHAPSSSASISSRTPRPAYRNDRSGTSLAQGAKVTKLYDRIQNRVTLDEVERIAI